MGSFCSFLLIFCFQDGRYPTVSHPIPKLPAGVIMNFKNLAYMYFQKPQTLFVKIGYHGNRIWKLKKVLLRVIFPSFWGRLRP